MNPPTIAQCEAEIVFLRKQLAASEDARKKAESELDELISITCKSLMDETLAYKQRAEAAEQRISEYTTRNNTQLETLIKVTEKLQAAERRILDIVRGDFNQICSYCGWESSDNAQWEELQAHIQVCKHHPIAELKRRVAELEKDAGRYQWLRPYLYCGSDYYANIETSIACCVDNPDGAHLEGNAIDSAIDAAIAKEQGK